MARSEEASSNHHGRWHWLGLAISLSYSMGLHRGASIAMQADTIQYGQFKRIWWTCFIYDRLIALSDTKPTRIRREDCSVLMVQASDFPRGAMSISGDLIYEADITQSFIEKAMLCWYNSDEMTRPLAVASSDITSDDMRTDDVDGVLETAIPASEEQSYDRDETRSEKMANEREPPTSQFEYPATTLEQPPTNQRLNPNDYSHGDLSAQPTYLSGDEGCNALVSMLKNHTEFDLFYLDLRS